MVLRRMLEKKCLRKIDASFEYFFFKSKIWNVRKAKEREIGNIKLCEMYFVKTSEFFIFPRQNQHKIR